MNCRSVMLKLDEYLEGDLPAATRQAIAAHLEVCASCRSEAEALRRAEEALRALSAIERAPDVALDPRPRAVGVKRRPSFGWAAVGFAAAASVTGIALWSHARVPVSRPMSHPQAVVATGPNVAPSLQAIAPPEETSAKRALPRVARRWSAGAFARERSHARGRACSEPKANGDDEPQEGPATTAAQTEAPPTVEGVILILGEAQPTLAFSSYVVEVVFPNGAQSVVERTVERDATGMAKTVQVACRQIAPADGAPNQGGVE